jgi:Ca-activated chloride channel family protein
MVTKQVNVTLKLTPERRLIHPTQCFRHVDAFLRVETVSTPSKQDRLPLTLALVLDRSGSMQGEKMATAKKAALAVLERLEERDQAAIVIFDDKIDVLQPAGHVTSAFKERARAAVAKVEARANTALHEGWLTGCKAIAPEHTDGERGVTRCFLLTDGLANVGVTDPEQIAGEAAGIREHAGISTSTFGIGDDYNESLLAPMAVAGGGQFHHLRSANEILNTFVGELGDLLAVAARRVRLELEAEAGMTADVISTYWTSTTQPGGVAWSVAIGDLIGGDERHVVVRFGFPEQHGHESRAIRARLVWMDEEGEQSTPWQELRFTYASPETCEAEQPNSEVLAVVGKHTSSRAQMEALRLNRAGDFAGANQVMAQATSAVTGWAASAPILQEEVAEMEDVTQQVSHAPASPAYSKEQMFRKQSITRGQKDHRTEPPDKPRTK